MGLTTKLRNKETGEVREIMAYMPDYLTYPPQIWEVVPGDTPVTPPRTGE